MAEHSTSTRAKTTTIYEVDLDNQQIYNDMEDIMKKRVEKSTRERYERSNINFIIYLFEHHNKYPSLLKSTLYNMMNIKNLKDLGWKQEANGLNQDMWFELSAVKRFKKSIQMAKLQYLSSWSIWHSPYSLGFWAPSRKSLKRGIQEQVSGDEQDVEFRLSASTYGISCSSLSHLYHDLGNNKEATSTQLWSKLLSYKKGSRRIAASEKHDLGLKLTEGNKALYSQAYKRITEMISQSNKIEHVADHTFIVLEWILISQSDNCVGSKVYHI